ncbi:hypothetical protein BVC80_37g10 [Macleaya cordata]|uniref:Uncharacterized protein n=1 Tax=Macleaya cordata TaxID=56857 RepID=A0A200QAN3_MACCD|nr:hypothetical protein BVC80_37g10 [Macleaya cordata]
MEANKERKEVEKNQEQQNQRHDYDDNHDRTSSSSSLNPTAKMLIQESIITKGEDLEKGGGGAQKPDDVLAFARSVNKVDSSLE